MHNEAWVARQSASDETRRVYEEERLIVQIFEHLSDNLDRAGISRADLAKKLGTSRAHITQLFSGQRNVTLRTLADVAWACGTRAAFALEPLRHGEFIDVPVRLVSSINPTIKVASTDLSEVPASGAATLAA